MRRYRLGVALALSAIWLTSCLGVAFPVTLPYHDDFESTPVNYYPTATGWHTWLPGVTAFVSNQVSYSPTRSFRLYSRGYVPRCDYLMLDSVPDRFAYQFSLYADPARGRQEYVGLAYYTLSSVPFVNYFSIRNQDGTNGSVFFTGATDLPAVWVGDFRIGQWVRLAALLDFQAEVADIWFGDVLVATGLPIEPRELWDAAAGAVTLNAFAVSEAKWNGSGYGAIYVDDVDLFEWAPPAVEATVDLKPETLNRKSAGARVTCYIELPEGCSLADIELGSLLLNGAVPANPFPAAIGDYDDDGIPDLMVKFDRAQLVAVLEPGDQVVELTGGLSDGTLLVGSDTVRVIH
jgi:hypothetical protein